MDGDLSLMNLTKEYLLELENDRNIDTLAQILEQKKRG
jgi:hypothetical protein